MEIWSPYKWPYRWVTVQVGPSLRDWWNFQCSRFSNEDVGLVGFYLSKKSKNWSWLIVGHQPSCKWDISPRKPLLVFITQVVIIEQKAPRIAKIHVSKRFSVRKFHYLMGMHLRHSMGLVYLPRFGDIWLIFMGSVGNYTMHWVFGHVWDATPCTPPREDAEFCRRIGEAGADVLQEIYDRTDGWKLHSVVKGKGKWKLRMFGLLTKVLGPTYGKQYVKIGKIGNPLLLDAKRG